MAGQYDLNLSNGSVFTTLYPLETNGPNNVSTPRLIQEARPQFLITGANVTTNEFIVIGDYTSVFAVGFIFEVVGSTGNNGTHTVSAVTFGGGNTTIGVTNVLDGTADGSIIAHVFRLVDDLTYRFVSGFTFNIANSVEINGTYTVTTIGSSFDGTYTYIPVGNGNIRDNNLPPIGLPLGDISYTILDTVSTLQLPGKGTVNYGENLIENMVRMTENFAADSSPDTNAVIGTTPAATPLVGQQWYNTTAGSEGFSVWDGLIWNQNNNLNGGALIFEDTEAAGNPDIYITASETNLPVGYVGTDETGLVIWAENSQVDDEAIFRVVSSDGFERFRVEYSSVANAGYIRSINNLELTSTGESYFHGKVGIGNTGLPTVERTLTVEGDGIAINSDAATDARLVIDASIGQVSSVDFEVSNAAQGSITANGIDLTISSAATNNLLLLTGSGFVGINQPLPTVPLDILGNTNLAGDLVVDTNTLYVDATNNWVGIKTAVATDLTDAMEVTGNLRINSQIFASDQTAAAPTYSFTNDNTTGMFYGGTNDLAFAANGALALTINSTGVLQVPVGYEANVSADTDITNKKYVDDVVGVISWREPVRVVDSTAYANVAAFPTGGVVDGITLVDGDRVLFSFTVNTNERDIYFWNAIGSTWLIDAANPQTVGDAVYIREGSSQTNVLAFSANNEWEPVGVGSGINVRYETQNPVASQLIFTLTTAKYSPATNRLQVYVDGVKQIIGLAYNETDPNTVTFIAPSPFVGTEVVEFIAFDELTANATIKREQQTNLDSVAQPIFTFAALTYQLSSDNLLVFVNGQKMIKDIDYTETSDSSITWIGAAIVITDVLEFYAAVPIVAGTKLRDIDDVSTAVPVNGDTIVYNTTTSLWEPGSAAPSTGTDFDYVVGTVGTVVATTNVTTTAKTATKSFVQVFLNGILQREDVAGFTATGNYFVSGANQLTFATALVATDEVLVYTL